MASAADEEHVGGTEASTAAHTAETATSPESELASSATPETRPVVQAQQSGISLPGQLSEENPLSHTDEAPGIPQAISKVSVDSPSCSNGEASRHVRIKDGRASEISPGAMGADGSALSSLGTGEFAGVKGSLRSGRSCESFSAEGGMNVRRSCTGAAARRGSMSGRSPNGNSGMGNRLSVESPKGSKFKPVGSVLSAWPSVFGNNNLRNEKSVRCTPDSGALTDDYKIVKTLGQGSFGLVQMAKFVKDENLEPVAVKSVELKKMLEISDGAMENELDIAKRLRHPNIALIHAVYRDTEFVHIVMEFCSGGDLFEQLAQGNFFSERKVARYLWQMVSGIAYCHYNNFCHRDIKPENYLLETKRGDADLKLIDFGLAKIYQKGVPMKTMVGSILYMAPEVFSDSGYDEKRDVWSIGIVGHMLLTRRMPFESVEEDEAVKEIKDGVLDFRWLEARLMGDHHLKKLIFSLLTASPKDRPTAKHLTRNTWFREQALEAPSRKCCGFSFDF